MTDPDLEFRVFGARSLQHLLATSRLHAAEGLVPSVGSNLLDDDPPTPHWASGLFSDFDAMFGGFSGLTLLAGPGGSGKSLAAMSCALENALEPGTLVVYFDCENAKGDQSKRAAAWFGSSDYFRTNMLNLTLHFHWHRVVPGHTYEQLMQFAARRVLDHERVLLVVDSVCSLARMLRGRALDNLSALWQSLAQLVTSSDGRIRVLGLSELNARGEVKGLEGVYAATLSLKLEAEPDLGDDVYRMHMVKQRNGIFRRNLGLYQVQHSQCRLSRYDTLRQHNSVRREVHG